MSSAKTQILPQIGSESVPVYALRPLGQQFERDDSDEGHEAAWSGAERRGFEPIFGIISTRSGASAAVVETEP